MNNIQVMNGFEIKYNIFMEFINALLVSIGKNVINSLTEFKDINRDDLISDNCLNIYDQYEPKIFTVFSKKECQWYRRKIIKNYLITVIRHMCIEINHKFTYKCKDVSRKLNGKTYRSKEILYSIEN